jgi:hypothetical protein
VPPLSVNVNVTVAWADDAASKPASKAADPINALVFIFAIVPFFSAARSGFRLSEPQLNPSHQCHLFASSFFSIPFC